ncbi:HlyD family type I secretion periplasmic adaptor subunit [Pseudogemmobacter sp. W21_MBD1_M6]|uniref:HlyD family type I secretion periplasmic adaptor subunit n=1 Tax=Pseudogemmobacter sp. W21_MBD1_M6 TaxID=3240271 RepID=UPI003F97A819
MADVPTTWHTGEWYDTVPRSVTRFAVIGFLLVGASFGGFGVWAFRAPLAAAVISQGSFVATGQNKIVQHLEGGIIREILAAEGDRVVKGQLLLRLDETAALANERELFLRRARLEAIEARLTAENAVSPSITFPPDLIEGRIDPEIAAILDNQLLAFRVSRTSIEGDIAPLMSNAAAMEMRAKGYATQLASIRDQLEIFEEDHEAKAKLLEQGLIRRTEFNALRRALAEATGQIGRLEAEISESEQMRQKYLDQIEQTRNAYKQAALDELQIIQSELDGIREQSRKAENVLARAVLTAPVSGTIVRSHYHTVGGVIEGGKPIMEILPSNAPLIIEAQIPRTDIDSVRTGQAATVRLVALNARTTPVLYGEVFYVSADSLLDASQDKRQEVYVARIKLSPDELLRVQGFKATPGMPAEIMIQTEERTFFQYLVKPIRDSMARAFRER